MPTMAEHYENLLADHYTWLFGGLRAKIDENRQFFEANNLKPKGSGLALDLGAGSGFQSIPLAQLGFAVTALDLSDKLTAELKSQSDGLNIRIIKDDLLNFTAYQSGPIELCVCMGDTLTHLQSLEDVQRLCKKVFAALGNQGRFVLTFRDLMHELKDLDRFIPVRNDGNRIFTCFLEYESEHVKVHDLVYEKQDGNWNFKKSMYRKCRVPFEWIKATLTSAGFQLKVATLERGLITIIAEK